VEAFGSLSTPQQLDYSFNISSQAPEIVESWTCRLCPTKPRTAPRVRIPKQLGLDPRKTTAFWIPFLALWELTTETVFGGTSFLPRQSNTHHDSRISTPVISHLGRRERQEKEAALTLLFLTLACAIQQSQTTTNAYLTVTAPFHTFPKEDTPNSDGSKDND